MIVQRLKILLLYRQELLPVTLSFVIFENVVYYDGK